MPAAYLPPQPSPRVIRHQGMPPSPWRIVGALLLAAAVVLAALFLLIPSL